jgi:cytoskeletal protein CcmA (bactofilin family)
MRVAALLKPTAVFVLISAAAALIWAQQSGESVIIRQGLAKDLYLAARDVRVLAPVEGDVVAAGQAIEIEGEVTDDVIAAGETVSIDGPVGDDVRAAGRRVLIGGPVGGHVVAAGAEVTIAAGRRVEDWAWLAGNRIEMAGSVESLKAAGANVAIAGEVRGNAELAGERLEIGPGAVIAGDLVWHSANKPHISATAQIAGRIVRKPPPEEAWRKSLSWVGGLVILLTLMLSVVVVYFVFPRFATDAARSAREEWWKALGLGLVILAVVPVAMVILFFTVIGWLLGVVLILAYLALLIVGGLLGLYSVSELGLRLIGRHEPIGAGMRIGGIVTAVVALALLTQIPIVGPLLALFVFLTGVGTFVLQSFRHYQGATLRPT